MCLLFKFGYDYCDKLLVNVSRLLEGKRIWIFGNRSLHQLGFTLFSGCIDGLLLLAFETTTLVIKIHMDINEVTLQTLGSSDWILCGSIGLWVVEEQLLPSTSWESCV
jgi:hypothetical protein